MITSAVMPSISPQRAMLATCAAFVLLLASPPTLAFSVTPEHQLSTINALMQWAVTREYTVAWELRTPSGLVNFPATPREMGDDFHSAVEALVSGSAYHRRNVFCVRPTEYQAQAIFNDEQRVVYVIARPTGDRCIFTFP